MLGDWSINQVVLDYVRENVHPDETILELGSGAGTGELAKGNKMVSIEESEAFVGKYDSTYIHAPIVDEWYDLKVLEEQLPKHMYGVILVDGPAHGKRMGFYDNLRLFNTNMQIIFDDINRDEDYEVMKLTADKLRRPFTILSDGATGVVL